MSFQERWPRRSMMVGGQLDGRELVLPLPNGVPDPPYRCHRRGVGPWMHYVRQADGTYHYAGKCETVDHDGLSPADMGERGCGCGQPFGHHPDGAP